MKRFFTVPDSAPHIANVVEAFSPYFQAQETTPPTLIHEELEAEPISPIKTVLFGMRRTIQKLRSNALVGRAKDGIGEFVQEKAPVAVATIIGSAAITLGTVNIANFIQEDPLTPIGRETESVPHQPERGDTVLYAERLPARFATYTTTTNP